MVSSILPKNERKNLTLLLWYLKSNCFRSFLGELKTPKRHFEINWPLVSDRRHFFVSIIDKKYLYTIIMSYFYKRWNDTVILAIIHQFFETNFSWTIITERSKDVITRPLGKNKKLRLTIENGSANAKRLTAKKPSFGTMPTRESAKRDTEKSTAAVINQVFLLQRVISIKP